MTTLVVGATGLVGSRVALGLRRKQLPVKALVRGGTKNSKAAALSAAGITIIDGDLTAPETLRHACEGIDTVVTTATSMPSGDNDGLRRVDLEGSLTLIDVALQSGVKKFVYTSYSGNLRISSPLETAKRTCEDRLLQAPMQTIILRPSYFTEVWLSPMLGFDPESGTARIYGTGETRGNYISAFDVAEFAITAAMRPYAAKNNILEMGGPQALSQVEVVRIFEQALGRKFHVDFVPLSALEAQHQSATDPLQKTFAALMLGYAKGDPIPGAVAVAREHGIELRSVADYAATFRAKTAGQVA